MLGYRDRYRKERLRIQVEELKSKGILPDSYDIDHGINLMPSSQRLLVIISLNI